MTGAASPALPGFSATRIYLACGVTDMRKGFDGLAVLVQQALEQSPHTGAIFAFRGKRGDLVKLLWYDGQGLCLFSKRMDRGKFVWPNTKTGSVSLTQAQLSMDGTCIGKKDKLVDELGEDAVDLMRRIKHAIDPQGIFNPGKIFVP